MNPLDQAKNYNRIADHWNSKDFPSSNGIDQHRKALRYLKNAGNAIDVGCGSSGRIIEMMVTHGMTVEGVDSSGEMIKRAKNRHPRVIFHHADICRWEANKKYDFISAWDSIWHVPLDSQEMLLRKLCGLLNPQGIIIFTSGAVDSPEEGTSAFLGQELYHAALGVQSTLKILAESNCVVRHLENDDWPGRHLYIIAQKEAYEA